MRAAALLVGAQIVRADDYAGVFSHKHVVAR